jgi:hypothetical protein
MMKNNLMVVSLIALMIAIITPMKLSAQNPNAEKAKTKNQKTENVDKPHKPGITITPGDVPPGQDGKAVKNDKVKGYEKTGDTGKKEGWSKESQNSKGEPGIMKNEKAMQKEMKKAEKMKKKEARRAEKEAKKQMKAADQKRVKSEKEAKEKLHK